MTASLSELIAKEVEKTLGRLRAKIIEAADIEDDFEIDMEKFAKNTAKKVVESQEFKDVVSAVEPKEKAEKKTEKTEKEKKDPNAPKGAKNSFIFFCNEKRQEVKEENSSLKATEITKKLGEMWKEEDEEEKKRYQKMAADDKKRYEAEIAEYEPKDGFKSPKKSKKVKSTAPKRALSAYLFFCQATRDDIKKKNPSIKSSEILSELGKMWKALSDKKKKPFEKLAQEDKTRYEEEMKEYVPTEEEKEAMDAKKKGKKGKKGAKEGPKRSLTAYLLFCKEKRDEVKSENKDKKMTEITSILGNMWSDLSEKKKKPYEEKAAKLKAEFDADKEEKAEKKVEKKSKKGVKGVVEEETQQDDDVEDDIEEEEVDENDEDDEPILGDDEEEEEEEKPIVKPVTKTPRLTEAEKKKSKK